MTSPTGDPALAGLPADEAHVPRVLADPEGVLRAWLRRQARVTAHTAQRVWIGLPDDYVPRERGAALALALVGTDVDPFVPVTTARVQVDAWGPTRQAAHLLAAAVVDVLWSLDNQREGDTLLAGARVLSTLWEPDSSTDPETPRYVVDVALTTRRLSGTELGQEATA